MVWQNFQTGQVSHPVISSRATDFHIDTGNGTDADSITLGYEMSDKKGIRLSSNIEVWYPTLFICWTWKRFCILGCRSMYLLYAILYNHCQDCFRDTIEIYFINMRDVIQLNAAQLGPVFKLLPR